VNSPLQTSSPQTQNVLSGDALKTPQNQVIDNSSGALSSTRSIDPANPDAPALSVVIPVFNEEESLHALHQKLQDSLSQLNLPFEVLYVDDGSRDSSFQILSDFAFQDSRVKVIRFRRNFGQTAAMSAGMEHAKGRVIIPLDADGQNDPADIRNLLDKMDEGFDVVSGWRKNRKDDSIRRIPSRIANRIISKVTGVPLHDYGCSLKAYRADVIKDVSLYGEMHRFIPAYAAMVGARVTEIPVQHHARVAGVSKYGIGRTFKVLLDLLVVKFLGGYGSKPIYFFGGAGVWSFVLAFVLWMIVAVQKFGGMHYSKVHSNPLFYIGMLAFAMGFQFLMLGLLAEVAIRTYHESQGKTTYTVAETRNIDKKVKA
jgi:glycosyltransferase involved in cell wall biosynthesis